MFESKSLPIKLFIFNVLIIEVFTFKVFSPFVHDFTYLDLKKNNGLLEKFNFSRDFSGNIEKEIMENINSCQQQIEDQKNFKNCLCVIFTCIEFYCELPKVLRNESNSRCLDPIKEPFKWHENYLLDYYLLDSDILLIYDELQTYKDFHDIRPIQNVMLHHYRKKLIVLYENFDGPNEFRVIFPSRRDAKEDMQEIYAWIIYLNNLSSFFAFVIILVFFVLVPQLRTYISGKCWIMFSITSMFNYSIFPISLFFGRYGRFILIFSEYYFNSYYFLEFSVYFWLIAICFETLNAIR